MSAAETTEQIKVLKTLLSNVLSEMCVLEDEVNLLIKENEKEKSNA